MVDIWVLGVEVLKFGISAKKGFRLMWSILCCDISFFGWASWQSCTTLPDNSNNDLMSAQDFERQSPQSERLRAAEVLRQKGLPSPETSSLVRRIFLHQKNLPSPEEASFIRRFFLRHESQSSSAESSVACRIIFR